MSNHINNKEQNVCVFVLDLSDESAPQRKIKELHRFLKTRMHVFHGIWHRCAKFLTSISHFRFSMIRIVAGLLILQF